MHRLVFFASINGFRILLIQVVRIGNFQFDLSYFRSERIIGSKLRKVIDGPDVTLFIEAAHAFFV